MDASRCFCIDMTVERSQRLSGNGVNGGHKPWETIGGAESTDQIVKPLLITCVRRIEPLQGTFNP
jgi:hypothetical protein